MTANTAATTLPVPKKRGRKPGPGRPLGRGRNPTKSDLYRTLVDLNLGEHALFEGSREEVARLRSRATVGDHRRPVELHGRRFTTRSYTAVCTNDSADILYLLRVERVE